MENQKFILSVEQEAFLDGFANIVDDKYYFIPFWFEKLDDGNWKIHKLGNLPENLKSLIKEIRKEKISKEE